MEILLINSIIGAIVVILFQYKNPHKDFINWVSVFVFLVISTSTLSNIYEWGLTLSLICIGGFLVTYIIRFLKKSSKKIIDYLKWFGVFFIMLLPPTILWRLFNSHPTLYLLNYLTFPVLIIIYVYDRFILIKEFMKKRYVIIFIAQTVLMLFFLVYAFIQKLEADKQREIAVVARLEAEKNFSHAEHLRKEAENKNVTAEEKIKRLQLELDELKKQVKK